MRSKPDPIQRFLRAVKRLFISWRFPSFMLFVLLFFTLLLASILVVPSAQSGLGAFAEDFRIWCFGYDPASGRLEWAYVLMLVVQPLILGTVIVSIWWRPLRRVMRVRPTALLPWAGAALLAVVGAGAGFAVLGDSDQAVAQDGPMPFPAESLRTELLPPEFTLTDHLGQPISLSELRGRVVLVTAVYATCGYTCPMILGQTRRAVDSLTEAQRADLTVVGITLDPKHDTPEVLAQMAAGQGAKAPLYRLATGDPATVERTLDDFNVARKRDPETGVIDHANLFILIDRAGRIAYRFSLGEQQERWLQDGLRLLLNERPGA